MKAIPTTPKALTAIALLTILLASTACQSSRDVESIPDNSAAESILPSPTATPAPVETPLPISLPSLALIQSDP